MAVQRLGGAIVPLEYERNPRKCELNVGFSWSLGHIRGRLHESGTGRSGNSNESRCEDAASRRFSKHVNGGLLVNRRYALDRHNSSSRFSSAWSFGFGTRTGCPPDLAPQYRLIDLGTLGGPISYYDGAQPGLMMNAKGTVIGLAERGVKDPHPSNCFESDCYMADAVSGTAKGLTDLPSLPGRNSGHTDAISDSGVVVGQSENGKVDPNLKVYAASPPTGYTGRSTAFRGLAGHRASPWESTVAEKSWDRP